MGFADGAGLLRVIRGAEKAGDRQCVRNGNGRCGTFGRS